MSTQVPIVCEKTIRWGRNLYRVNINGNWQTLMWGWWPDSNDRPSYRWMPIPLSDIPAEVIQAGKEKS